MMDIQIGVYILKKDVNNPEHVDMRRGGRSHGAQGRRAGSDWRWAPKMKKGTTVFVEYDALMALDGDFHFFLRPAGAREWDHVSEKRAWFQAVLPHLKLVEKAPFAQIFEITHYNARDVMDALLKDGILTRERVLQIVGWPHT